MISAPIHYYPNRMGRIVLLAMDEILGHRGGIAVLNLAHLPDLIDKYPAYDTDLKFPFDHVSRLQTAFESLYGNLAGRGLSLRVGRACLKYGLREFGPQLGVTSLTFRLLPLPTRLVFATEALAGLFNQSSSQHVHLDVEEEQIYWHIERCPLCSQRQTAAPCCDLAVGLLQETFYWVSGGKYYTVEEKKCIACGNSTCTIVIDRTPMS
jgi:predicted hydrocarbon binding protein